MFCYCCCLSHCWAFASQKQHPHYRFQMTTIIIRSNEPMNVNDFLEIFCEKENQQQQKNIFCSIDVMTSTMVDGIKRSNVCGDGYRIEGALLKSSPYSIRQSYSPYENCHMTFKVGFDRHGQWKHTHLFLRLVVPIIRSVFGFYSSIWTTFMVVWTAWIPFVFINQSISHEKINW